LTLHFKISAAEMAEVVAAVERSGETTSSYCHAAVLARVRSGR
jgi:hypothetical protein